MEWLPVAPVADVGTRPTAVVAGGVPLVLWRPAPSAEPVAFADRCPQENTPPPRADLPAGPRVRVADGMVAVAAEDLRRLDSDPDDLLTNVDSALRYAWHPVALASEWPCSFELLGDTYPSEASFWGVQERWGLIWVALDEPLTGFFPDADADDAAYVGAWLPPARTPAPAGAVADNFLDVAHFPFVHAGAFEEAVLAEDLALQRGDAPARAAAAPARRAARPRRSARRHPPPPAAALPG